MTTLIILVAIYLLFAYGSWKMTQRAFSKGGHYEKIDVGIFDIIFVITPLLNIILFFILLSVEINHRNSNAWNKFFKIKK